MSIKKPWGGKFPEEWHGIVPQNQQITYGSYVKSIKNEETFHIGQGYEDHAAKLQRCKICGGTEFQVGLGSHFTAIRCPKCQWEQCIHDG